MEYLVTRLYADGIRLQQHLRNAGVVRGSLSITAEKGEALGMRAVLVAKVHAASSRTIPHLRNVQLLGTHGESWVLSGHEELESGPMRKACRLGQVWVIEPAGIDELVRAEGKWQDAARELHEARERLRAAGLE